MPEPIEPTAVIPAGWPLPSRQPATTAPPPVLPPPPMRPPAVPPPGLVRPRPPVPPPAPVPAGPQQVDVHVRIDVFHPTAPEPPKPTWADVLQLRRNLLCCAAGFLPAIAWGRTLHACWQEADLRAAWILATTLAVAAAVLDQRHRGRTTDNPTDRGRGSWWTRTALCAALMAPALGLPLLGTATYIVTGVHP